MSNSSTEDPTVGQGTERLNELAFSFKKSQALAAALEVGLFSAIAGGARTMEAIAEACAIPAEAVDRLLVACGAPLVGGVIFTFADSLMMMMAGQMAISVGRGVFWPASQSIASVLEGERSVQMGRLNASVSTGQITGTAGAGGHNRRGRPGRQRCA